MEDVRDYSKSTVYNCSVCGTMGSKYYKSAFLVRARTRIHFCSDDCFQQYNRLTIPTPSQSMTERKVHTIKVRGMATYASSQPGAPTHRVLSNASVDDPINDQPPGRWVNDPTEMPPNQVHHGDAPALTKWQRFTRCLAKAKCW